MNFKKIAEKNKILEVKVGSHLFGTDTPESDEDFVGIFMPDESLLFGFQQCEEVKFDIVAKDESGRNTAEAVDRTLHEYRKFCRLALQNNPNILHILFTDERSIVFEDEFGACLRGKVDLFVHRGCYSRFIGYASAQKHKMIIRADNYVGLEQGLEILEKAEDFKVMADFRDVSPFKVINDKHIKVGDILFEPGVYVKKARKLLRDRMSKATNRLSLMTKYGMDTKYASNLIHLLREGIDILRYGKLEFPLPYAQDIVDIKRGKYTAEEVMEWADKLEREAKEAYDTSIIREKPLSSEIEDFVIDQVRSYLK